MYRLSSFEDGRGGEGMPCFHATRAQSIFLSAISKIQQETNAEAFYKTCCQFPERATTTGTEPDDTVGCANLSKCPKTRTTNAERIR